MFKKYDIRGIYPDQINEKISYKLGRSIGTYFDGISFGVGRDTRDTSKKIEEHLIKGLMDSGSDVNYIGVSTTPIMSFYSMKENKKSLEITASHNPKEYTGIKFFSEDGMPFNNFEGIKEIFESKNFIDAKGNFKNIEDFGENYVDKFTKKFHSNLTVVVDTLGGAASYYCPKSLERIGCNVVSIYDEYSGNFYGRNPEPKKSNLHDLQNEVLHQGADFGVAIDPDGDRAVFVDNNGSVIEGSDMNCIFLKELPKPLKAVATIDNSQTLEKMKDVDIIWSKIGNVYVERLVREYNADFGCEASGHFCFGKYLPTMDGTLSSLVLADLLNDSEKKLSDLHEEIEKANIFYKNFKYETVQERDKIFDKVLDYFGDRENISVLDGIKVIENDYWFLLRPSNTEPKIRLTIEGNSNEENEKIFSEIKGILGEINGNS